MQKLIFSILSKKNKEKSEHWDKQEDEESQEMAVNSKEAFPLLQRQGDKTNPPSDWITINQFPGFLFSLSTQVGHNNSTIFCVILSPKGVAWV